MDISIGQLKWYPRFWNLFYYKIKTFRTIQNTKQFACLAENPTFNSFSSIYSSIRVNSKLYERNWVIYNYFDVKQNFTVLPNTLQIQPNFYEIF